MNQRVPERVRIVIRQSRPSAGFPKNIAYGVGVRPWRPIEPYGAKSEVLDLCDWSLGTRDRPVRIPSARVGTGSNRRRREGSRRRREEPLVSVFACLTWTSRGSCWTSFRSISRCFRRNETIALSRAPVRMAKAMRARSRLAISQLSGIAAEHGANVVERRARFEPMRGRYSRHAARRAEIFRARILDL